MKKTPLVSVVVPVFNREKSVPFCIESILNSNTKDIEVLVVDDGSTDSTPELIRRISDTDARVRCFRQENLGVSSARNLGLENARGEWIAFVDSDDCISPRMFEVIETTADLPDLFIFKSRSLMAKGDTSNIPLDKRTMQSKKIEGNCVEFLYGEYNPYKNPVYPVWGKLFRREIIESNGIRFDEGCDLGEDQIFTCSYLEYVETVEVVDFVAYFLVSWRNLIHLGGKLRTPENFLHNQKKNWGSLEAVGKNLSANGNNGGGYMHAYAVNYIIDRPFTRIFLRHAIASGFSEGGWDELFEFGRREILPLWNCAFDSAVCVRNKDALRAYELLKSCKKEELLMLCKKVYAKESFRRIVIFPLRLARFLAKGFRRTA